MEGLTNAINSLNETFNSIKTFFEHPFINAGKWLLTCLVVGSKPICLSGAVISLMLYIFGFESCAKYVGFFCLLYFIIQCMGMIL